MGRIHDALKKAEEERKKRREGQTVDAPAPAPAPKPAPAPAPRTVTEIPVTSRVEAPRPEPTRAETVRTEPIRTEPVRKESARSEPPRRPVMPVETAAIELPQPESHKVKKGIAAGIERARQTFVDSGGGHRFGELLLTLHAPTDQRSEQIRAIRTNILGLRKVPQVLAVTSAVTDEGAGLTASNLAVCFAEDLTQKILLVDADLRGSRLRGFFDVAEDQPGFTEILEGKLDPRKAMVPSGLANLQLVTAGRAVENPGGLLASQALAGMVAAWREDFDRIVFVLPPVNEASDAAVIGRELDGVLMVVKLSATPRRESEHAIEALSASGVGVIGCVVTNAGRVRERPGRRG
ncbi:MAG: CpsD/CapB family tyrosine-protein kinase [Planctomycetes bacterium]|nr:CpsD/CapB family tyrosine-protein kinase [Planctomycetota bacterium]